MKQGMKKQKTKDFSCVSQSFHVYIYILKREESRLLGSKQEYFFLFFFSPTIEAFCILMDKCPFGKKKSIFSFFFTMKIYIQ